MVRTVKSTRSLVLRLIVGLALLGWPRIGTAAGTWSAIPFPVRPGEVAHPAAVAVDAVGNLYVADQGVGVQRRDPQGNWTVIAGVGRATGQVSFPTALSVDAAGNLYVAERGPVRVQKRDAQGKWTVIPTPVAVPTTLAVDTAGHLYVAEGYPHGSIRKRDTQGNWTVIAPAGSNAGQVTNPRVLAVNLAGDLYVAEWPGTEYRPDGEHIVGGSHRIQKRDARGNWSVIAAQGQGRGQVYEASALAVDTAGNLYVADYSNGWRVQKRDARGSWSVIAAGGTAPGQVQDPTTGLAVDTAGHLYVADGYYATSRIQQRDDLGRWSVIATAGDVPTELLTINALQLSPLSLAVDATGNLYLTDRESSQVLKRGVQENWSILAGRGDAPALVHNPQALAVDRAGTLYVSDQFESNGDGQPAARIQQRDTQGRWSIIATAGTALGQVDRPAALAVDAASNLYVADQGSGRGRIQKRDVQGNWSVVANGGDDLGQVTAPQSLAVDTAGNLYVAERVLDCLDVWCAGRLWKRDAQGTWSVIATQGTGLGQVWVPTALAADTAGNLYVADGGYPNERRIQKRDAQGQWSVIDLQGFDLDPYQGISGLAADSAGNLYAAGPGNFRVQENGVLPNP